MKAGQIVLVRSKFTISALFSSQIFERDNQYFPSKFSLTRKSVLLKSVIAENWRRKKPGTGFTKP